MAVIHAIMHAFDFDPKYPCYSSVSYARMGLNYLGDQREQNYDKATFKIGERTSTSMNYEPFPSSV